MDLKPLIESLKSQIAENDGELAYWGDPIALTAPAVKTAVSGSKKDLLQRLYKETIGDCQLCPLWEKRKNIVFGVGNPDSKVMFVGEGPGFDEDRLGEPFVGKAGQLLDKIMAAIGLDRTNSYIANIVKCHPMVDPSQPEKRGNDRPPSPSEIEACLPFLKEQISIIQPSIIVALGSTSAKTLLGRSDGITKVRGQVFNIPLVEGLAPIPVLPTFHPAALLRDPELKKPVWEDMKLLRSIINS
jgi:uracil-DNA glycosylase